MNTRISFDDLRKLFKLRNREEFTFYFKKVFRSIASDRTDLLISKFHFNEWMQLPIFISEKLFASFKPITKGSSDYLSEENLLKMLTSLYFGSYETTSRIIFDLFDFDHDGIINKYDMKSILTFLPFKSDSELKPHQNQEQILEEIDQYLHHFFKEVNKVDFEYFLERTQENSELFLQILCFLYHKSPFNQNNISRAVFHYCNTKNQSTEEEHKLIQQFNNSFFNTTLSESEKYEILLRLPEKTTKLSSFESYLEESTNNSIVERLNNLDIVRLISKSSSVKVQENEMKKKPKYMELFEDFKRDKDKSNTLEIKVSDALQNRVENKQLNELCLKTSNLLY